MFNYGEIKIDSLLGSRNWDDHTEDEGLQELIGGWTIEGAHILKDNRHFTTDCILILREPNGKYRALNISNPTHSRRIPKTPIYGPLRIELERLPGEPPLMRTRAFFRDLEETQQRRGMTAEEREAWYSEGHITFTEFNRLEAAEEIGKYKPILEQMADAGLWGALFSAAKCSHYALSLALAIATPHAKEIELNEWKEFILYSMSFVDETAPELLEALATLPKDGAKDLPEEYDGEEVEVYRVGSVLTGVEIYGLGERPIWSYDKTLSVYEYNNKLNWPPGRPRKRRLYKGKIKRNDIIFVNDSCKELIQLNNVYDVELIGNGERLENEEEEG